MQKVLQKKNRNKFFINNRDKFSFHRAEPSFHRQFTFFESVKFSFDLISYAKMFHSHIRNGILAARDNSRDDISDTAYYWISESDNNTIDFKLKFSINKFKEAQKL